MDESISSAAGQVVKIITDAVEAIAKERDGTKGAERDKDLFFPEGIGDIHVSFKAPGGVAIDVTIASSPPKVADFERGGPPKIRATEHPMNILVKSGGPLYAKFSVYGEDWSEPRLLVVGSNDFTAVTPDG